MSIKRLVTTAFLRWHCLITKNFVKTSNQINVGTRFQERKKLGKGVPYPLQPWMFYL